LDNLGTSRYLEINGTPLFLREHGKGMPTLLLHAGIADGRMWAPQLAGLGDKLRLIMPDLWGYGQSSIPNRPFAYHQDMAALLDALAVPTAWVIGVSFGSRVGLGFTLAYPARVRGLVLISPLLDGLNTSQALASFDAEEERLLESGDLAGATELNLRTWVDGPHRSPDQVDPGVRAAVARMQMAAFRVPVPEEARVIHLAPPAGARLHEIALPTLILVGELDVEDVREHAQVIARTIPNARLERIPATAHMLTMEAPQAVNRLVAEFVGDFER
jgi:pimeloyl-ACP methyl ester carboxylesterase